MWSIHLGVTEVKLCLKHKEETIEKQLELYKGPRKAEICMCLYITMFVVAQICVRTILYIISFALFASHAFNGA